LLAELSTQVQAEFDEAIRESMEAVYARLNVIFDPETDRSVDGRDPRVQAIERQITDYTAETFQDVSVRLEFPTPESRVMFDNARVWIHEQGFGDVPVDQSGEGVKRVLIFSLFRTLADLRQGKLSLSDPHPDEEVPAESYPPLLILYEEAELFLHPGLQRTLLRAFSDLRDSGAQVIYTTHSPFMLQGKWLSSISLVSKIPLAGTQVTGFHTKLSSMAPKDMNLLLQVQNVSSYMFADRVLLVEGESDRIVLSKLAPALHPEWDFAKRGIPILSVAGKGNLPLFRGFLLSLGIETYVVTDIDSVKAVLLKLCTSTCVRESQSKLLQVCDDLIESGSVATKFNKREVSKLVSSYNWNQVFDSLEELYEAYRDGQAPAEEQIDCLRRLVSSRAEAARTTALVSDHHDIVRIRTELAKLLLGEGIMLLSGTIEDYYPSDGGNKIERALQFDPQKFSKSELQSHFVNLPDTGTTDMQAFLSKVFGTP